MYHRASGFCAPVSMSSHFGYGKHQCRPARSVAVAEMAFPLTAVLVNWLTLGKTLEPVQMLGAAVLMGGSTMVALTQIDDSRYSGETVLDLAAAQSSTDRQIPKS